MSPFLSYRLSPYSQAPAREVFLEFSCAFSKRIEAQILSRRGALS